MKITALIYKKKLEILMAFLISITRNGSKKKQKLALLGTSLEEDWLIGETQLLMMAAEQLD